MSVMSQSNSAENDSHDDSYIRSFGDSLGVVFERVEDIDYLKNEMKLMLSILINDSFLFGRHCRKYDKNGKKKLTSQDIKCALKMKNYDKCLAIGSNYNKKYQISGKNETNNKNNNNKKEESFIMCENDPIVKFSNLITNHNLNNNNIKGIYSKTPEISVLVQWIAIDGRKILEIEPSSNDESKQSGKNENGNILNSFVISPILSHSLSKEQQMFYETLCHSILNCNNESLSKLIEIIETRDAGLAHLIPYIVSFISQTIMKEASKSENDNINLLFSCVIVIESIIISKYVCWHLENYLQQLMPSLLTLILKNNICNKNEKHWFLREKCSILIKLLIDKFGDKYPGFIKNLQIYLMKKLLNYQYLSINTFYGILIILYQNGHKMIDSILIPHAIVLFKQRLLNNNKDDGDDAMGHQMVVNLFKKCINISYTNYQLNKAAKMNDNDNNQQIYLTLKFLFSQYRSANVVSNNAPKQSCGNAAARGPRKDFFI